MTGPAVDPTPTVQSRAPTPPPTQAIPTINGPKARLALYLAVQTANGLLMFAKFDPESWAHVACCVVIFVIGSLKLFGERSRA